MLVVVAGHGDPVAGKLIERWAGRAAAQLAPADLSAAGWRHHVGANGPGAGGGTAVVGGRVIATREITGVVTRLPAVFEQELGWVEPPDRAYVASEMTAFLTAWLSALSCPVLNRPTAGCLAGPGLTPEHWTRLAAHVGIPVVPVRRRTLLATPADTDEGMGGARAGVRDPAPAVEVVTVVGERCLGGAGALAGWAVQLARAAGAELLAVQFERIGAAVRFGGASPWPDLSAPDVAAAIAERLERR
jgi:hypothetical protein